MNFEYKSIASLPPVIPYGPEADAAFKKYDKFRARVKAELAGLIGTTSFGSMPSFHFPLVIETTDLPRLLDESGFHPLAANGEDVEALQRKIRKMRIRTSAEPAYPVAGERPFRRFELPAISIEGDGLKDLILNFGHLRQSDSGWQLANGSSGEMKLYPLSALTYFKAE